MAISDYQIIEGKVHPKNSCFCILIYSKNVSFPNPNLGIYKNQISTVDELANEKVARFISFSSIILSTSPWTKNIFILIYFVKSNKKQNHFFMLIFLNLNKLYNLKSHPLMCIASGFKKKKLLLETLNFKDFFGGF